MTILITGAAGYIGSHVSYLLTESLKPEIDLIGVDNLHKGSMDNAYIPIIVEDIRNKENLRKIFEEYKPSTIMHLAALTSVPESAEKKQEYFDVNTTGTKNILDCMVEFGCKTIIFSSTASVYEQVSHPVKEFDAVQPLNNYALSKLNAEQDIKTYAASHGINYTIFRYFNVIGYANWYNTSRETSKTNIVPSLLRCMNTGDTFKVYGNTYSTTRENPNDHTCVRDYIDVRDIANAHLHALVYHDLHDDSKQTFNLGTKHGTSVLELLDAFERANQVKIPYEIVGPRVGDPSFIVADSTKAKELLCWKPEYTLEQSLTIF